MKTETLNFFCGTKHGKKKYEHWEIEHNLHDIGLSLDPIFDAWVKQCDDPQDLLDFIDFVKLQDPQIICHAKK